LSEEWTSIEPPEPLRTGGRLEQKFCLQIAVFSDMDPHNGVTLASSGQRHVIESEAEDRERTEYPLWVAEIAGDHTCLYRAGERAPGPDFPSDRMMVRLRLRSEPPLQVGKNWWRSYDPF